MSKGLSMCNSRIGHPGLRAFLRIHNVTYNAHFVGFLSFYGLSKHFTWTVADSDCTAQNESFSPLSAFITRWRSFYIKGGNPVGCLSAMCSESSRVSSDSNDELVLKTFY